jgi:hypothetical protein
LGARGQIDFKKTAAPELAVNFKPADRAQLSGPRWVLVQALV